MKKSSSHTIDFLFPIALFFVFSASSLVALLLAATLYQKQVDQSSTGFWQDTALSYLTEKIRQNDVGGSDNISITTFDGHEALAIYQEYNEISYTTYIYVADGFLTELFTQSDTKVSSAGGSRILEVDTLKMEEIKPGLFRFTCVSEDGTSESVLVSTYSE